MTSKTRSFHISPAMIVASVALLLAFTGSAIAAGVAKNSVRSAQIVDGTVRTVDLRDSAVNSAKVADETLTAGDLAADSVGSSEIAADAVGASEVAANAVNAGELGTITQRVSNPQAIAAGANGSVSVDCAPGEQIISGGGQPANFGVEMTSSRPSGNGWLYQAKNNNGAASTITAFALCLAS